MKRGYTEFDTDVEEDVEDMLYKVTNRVHELEEIVQSLQLSISSQAIKNLPEKIIISWREIVLIALVLIYTLKQYVHF